jgi:hypothetical protein
MTKTQFKEYCEVEFESLQKVISEIFIVVQRDKDDYSTADLAAISTFLHNFYNGVENLLKRVVIFRNIEVPKTPTWHKDLLNIALSTGIIDSEIFAELLSYLSFRHFFIHSYVFKVSWDDLKPLVGSVEELSQRIQIAISNNLTN